MIEDNQVLDFGAPSETAEPGAKTMPDGEKQSHKDADAEPGNPQADPQNLAKDAQAVGGIVGTQEEAEGASSLGQQVGSAGAGLMAASDAERAVQEAVDGAPKPEGKIRTSWLEQGHTNS